MSLPTLVWEVREFNINDMVHCELANFDAGEWSHASVIHYCKCSWAAQRAKSASTVPTVAEINLCRVPKTHAQFTILWGTPQAPIPKTALPGIPVQTGAWGIKGTLFPRHMGIPVGPSRCFWSATAAASCMQVLFFFCLLQTMDYRGSGTRNNTHGGPSKKDTGASVAPSCSLHGYWLLAQSGVFSVLTHLWKVSCDHSILQNWAWGNQTKYCLLLLAVYTYIQRYCWLVAIVDRASSDASVKLRWVINQWPYFIVFDITVYRLKKFTFIRSRKLTDIADNSVMPV